MDIVSLQRNQELINFSSTKSRRLNSHLFLMSFRFYCLYIKFQYNIGETILVWISYIEIETSLLEQC